MVSVRATSKKVKNNENRKHENVIRTRSKSKMINTVKYDEKKKSTNHATNEQLLENTIIVEIMKIAIAITLFEQDRNQN